MGIRSLLKSIFPLPADRQRREFTALKQSLASLEKSMTALSKEVRMGIDSQGKALASLDKEVRMGTDSQRKALASLDSQGKALASLGRRMDGLERLGKLVHRGIEESCRIASEAVWAEIFKNATEGCDWVRSAYAPGRWAVGYPYLYVMFRGLSQFKPRRVLELGLGQSTRMLASYTMAHDGVEHVVVEHDQKWIDFFCGDFPLSGRSQLLRLDWAYEPFREAESVRVFDGFGEHFQACSFDFISIDAPLGGDMEVYSRIDVLRLLPGILSEDFVIMIDDTNRPQEQNTVKAMQEVLEEQGVAFRTGRYRGAKECTLLCSERLSFLASL